MNIKTLISNIVPLQQESITQWEKNKIVLTQTDFLQLVEENHCFNFQLWKAEDQARREDLGYEGVYRAKRDIDQYNQQRNNRMEAMDQWLFAKLKPSTHTNCPIHSETPGMMIDRLSILSLKHYHMNLQILRKDANDTHRQICKEKCFVIAKQQAQLLSCLQLFIQEILANSRTFRLYYQVKMYNDPTMHPHLNHQKTA